MKLNVIYPIDCIDGLRTLPDACIDACITSPPYYGLRDYGTENQLGLERTPTEYVAKLVEIFSHVYRVLKAEGTLWLNLGDSYSSHKDCKSISQTIAKGTNREHAHVIEKGKSRTRDSKMLKKEGLKNKDLIGIPWRVAFALQQYGWYLRQDIIWSKPNPMPESVKDRCTKAHEYIFLLSKAPKYYYDYKAILELAKYDGRKDTKVKSSKKYNNSDYLASNKAQTLNLNGRERWIYKIEDVQARNKRSVWNVATKPFREAHFATFPPDLILPCILAGCPPNGIVLDPFMGAGTTAMVASQNGRNYIGFELNPTYVKMAVDRVQNCHK
ncbi:site-specific DNA-methyltransferase [Sphingobacteriales bacterium UPWRP_1]|nr:site-specific DNA-methyltransferase [Sphingobacteriales bacterium UPWRP_1]